jgi:predicted nucleic acid-binding protein
MNVLVDTSIWSLALRRDAPRGSAEELELVELIREDRVVMLGPVRQELLSGVRSPQQFELLRSRLRAFPDLILGPGDYEEAARCFNRCRAKGIQGSNTDFLLCAVALSRELAIFTTDKDFLAFRKVLHMKLHASRA